MNGRLAAVVVAATGAHGVERVEVVQSLWSGYGQLVRCHLDGASRPSVIAKHVRWPVDPRHPRGWATGRSHERKLESYRVETAWYRDFAHRCPAGARVPHCLAVDATDDDVILVLEDLDTVGFAGRRTEVDRPEFDAGLSWLATFHAAFLGVDPDQLWPTGTYWHLATRPDELAELEDGPLKSAAGEIDRRLRSSPFQSLVHGDAKLANFCFSDDGLRVAAVDFQYVGGGCGMKDLAYFVGSCFGEDDCERLEDELLDRYFGHLRDALRVAASTVDVDALERDWRSLYRVAWTDFYRFLKGWSPGHWKLHGYSERVAAEVVASL